MRPVQHFTDAYLAQCQGMTTDQVIRFLEDFRTLHAQRPSRSKLISLKVPEDLLQVFRQRAELAGVPYQSQIKRLMREWVLDGRQEIDESL
ncbi:MAG: CopG family antitoxin [Gammaproteobacteria bacterium]